MSGESEPLAAGERRWVSFEYLGDGSQIEIRMYMDAVDNAAFSVWTPEQLRQLAAGEEVEPVGRGTANDYEAGEQFWAGSLCTPGTYSVVVQNGSASDASFKLGIAD